MDVGFKQAIHPTSPLGSHGLASALTVPPLHSISRKPPRTVVGPLVGDEWTGRRPAGRSPDGVSSKPVPAGTKSRRSHHLWWWLGILRFAIHWCGEGRERRCQRRGRGEVNARNSSTTLFCSPTTLAIEAAFRFLPETCGGGGNPPGRICKSPLQPPQSD
jgi:hypothetical protein